MKRRKLSLPSTPTIQEIFENQRTLLEHLKKQLNKEKLAAIPALEKRKKLVDNYIQLAKKISLSQIDQPQKTGSHKIKQIKKKDDNKDNDPSLFIWNNFIILQPYYDTDKTTNDLLQLLLKNFLQKGKYGFKIFPEKDEVILLRLLKNKHINFLALALYLSELEAFECLALKCILFFEYEIFKLENNSHEKLLRKIITTLFEKFTAQENKGFILDLIISLLCFFIFLAKEKEIHLKKIPEYFIQLIEKRTPADNLLSSDKPAELKINIVNNRTTPIAWSKYALNYYHFYKSSWDKKSNSPRNNLLPILNLNLMNDIKTEFANLALKHPEIFIQEFKPYSAEGLDFQYNLFTHYLSVVFCELGFKTINPEILIFILKSHLTKQFGEKFDLSFCINHIHYVHQIIDEVVNTPLEEAPPTTTKTITDEPQHKKAKLNNDKENIFDETQFNFPNDAFGLTLDKSISPK